MRTILTTAAILAALVTTPAFASGENFQGLDHFGKSGGSSFRDSYTDSYLSGVQMRNIAGKRQKPTPDAGDRRNIISYSRARHGGKVALHQRALAGERFRGEQSFESFGARWR